MAKRLLWPLLPGVLALMAGAGAMLAGPATRTKAFFAMQRAWAAHWPLEHGILLPAVLEPPFEPFVPVWVQVEPHIKMLLDPNDLLSRRILETGVWEPDSWRAMREHLHPGDTFVDVGAHIGYYSLKAATVVGPGGHVIAVEPNPETVRKLQGNISASGASGVIAVAPVACSDAEATLELFAAPESNTGETSLSRANASQTGAVVTTYRVRARPLDDIIRETGVSRADVLKIDVEGAEYLVLKGAEQTLTRYHPVVIVELVESQLQAMGTSTAAVTALLRSHGYTWKHSYGSNFEFAQ